MHIKEEQLKKILLESGIIDDKSFTAASVEAERGSQSIENILIAKGQVTEDYLAELLEAYFGVPLINLRQIDIPLEVLTLLPENFAKGNLAALFEYDQSRSVGKLAMIDPFDFETLDFVRAKLGNFIEPYLTSRPSLSFALRQYRHQSGATFNQIIDESIKQSVDLDTANDLSKTAEAVPVITILDSILENAALNNASDIHFEPLAKKFLIRCRIDGVMQEVVSLPKMLGPLVAARVKILSGMQIDEHRMPQDGRFRFEYEAGQKMDVRVNVMPVLHGEKVEMRLLKSSSKPLSLSELGLSEAMIAQITIEISQPHGMILITGPTGHGKTTTLYSILHMLNTPNVNITTIEDPIEYEMGGINQTQVNTKAGITFASGLRSLLRQNPDIIMIGEVRDNETADIAIHSALTGHLVLSSLHTNDAAAAIPRLIDMGAQPFLLASTLNLVIAQRLVRKICMNCIESYKSTPQLKAQIKRQLGKTVSGNVEIELPKDLFRGKGCRVCGKSGFSGQIGIFEVFKASEAVRQAINSGSTLAQIHKIAMDEGMVSMLVDGMAKVTQGITTLEEVIRVVRE